MSCSQDVRYLIHQLRLRKSLRQLFTFSGRETIMSIEPPSYEDINNNAYRVSYPDQTRFWGGSLENMNMHDSTQLNSFQHTSIGHTPNRANPPTLPRQHHFRRTSSSSSSSAYNKHPPSIQTPPPKPPPQRRHSPPHNEHVRRNFPSTLPTSFSSQCRGNSYCSSNSSSRSAIQGGDTFLSIGFACWYWCWCW